MVRFACVTHFYYSAEEASRTNELIAIERGRRRRRPTYIVIYLINPTQARKLISSLIEKPLYTTRRLTK